MDACLHAQFAELQAAADRSGAVDVAAQYVSRGPRRIHSAAPRCFFLSESCVGTVLHYAAQEVHVEVVKVLIGLGADVHAQRKT
jgi:hypothetical protein